MSGKTAASAPVADAPARPRADRRERATSPLDALDAWSRPDAWRWLEGRWALSGTVMGVPVAPPGDVLRLAVDSVGVTFKPGADGTFPLPVITFDDDGRPAVRLEGLDGDGPSTALRAVAATRRSVTFQDSVSAGSAAPAVMKFTIRRAGPNIFHVIGDTGVGPAPVPLLAYTALKLNGGG